MGTRPGRLNAISGLFRSVSCVVLATICNVADVWSEDATSDDEAIAPALDHGELNILENYAHPEDKESHLPSPGLMGRYFRWKESLRERTGLTFMVEYAPIFQLAASEFHADHELNLIGLWDAVDHEAAGSGALFVWFQHALTWGELTTSEFMDALGVVSPVNGGDTFPGTNANRLQLLAWEQVLPGDALRLMAGKITTRVTFNQNRYAVSDREDFFTPMIVNNPVVLFTARAGLGLFAQFRRERWYVSAMVRDADAQDDYIDFDSIDSGKWEYMSEFAWTPTRSSLGDGNYRVTYHYTDEVGAGAGSQAAGWSVSASVDQDVYENVGVFARYAYADEPVRVFQSRVAVGAQLIAPFGFHDDRIGVGYWWGETTDAGLDDESGVEMFWRLQAARSVEMTPGVQFIFDPALDPERSVVSVFGFRVRIVL